MSEPTVDRTVLFADIAGSTRLYDEHGDELTQRILSDCLDLMERTVREGKGTVKRRIGDEILCTFLNPNDAALAAMQLQSVVSDGHVRGTFPVPIRIRIGFEHGPIIDAPDALYGNVVHSAARVAALAKARQILTTAGTAAMFMPALRSFSRYFDRIVLKGLRGEQEIHEIVWDISEATVPGQHASKARTGDPVAVELSYAGQVIRADSERPRVELGRDAACDLAVRGSAVSKLHARILWSRGGIELEDISTNGTFLEQEGEPQRRLHHERCELQGEGVLRLGDARDAEAGALIRFRCVP
ncbi:MAG: adenylate/guanylate cyclase domain-containing protein [Planctomycetota bacterium]|jgi:class 3 adenylate cyclase